MKKLFMVVLFLCISTFGYANSLELYSDTFINAIKNHLPDNCKFYIDDVQDSDNYYFASVVEFYENEPPLPHLLVFDEKLRILKDIIIEDFSHFWGRIILEDMDKDNIKDVVVMTGVGANSNRIDVFLNKLSGKNDLVKIFSAEGNYVLKFYVALGVPTIEISTWTGTLEHPITVIKWDGKEFISKK